MGNRRFQCGHEHIVEVKENEDRSYLYDVGGEQKETIPFTKELRQWLQSFIAIGGRYLDTLAEVRELTKHEFGQVMICFENNGVYQFQNVTTADNGDTSLKPDNVDELLYGRWILKTTLSGSGVSLWSILKYTTSQDEDQIMYVDNIDGADSITENGTVNNPFKTIQYAIDTYVTNHGYWKGELTIRLLTDYSDAISLVGLIGNGSLRIGSSNLAQRNISADSTMYISNNQVKIRLNGVIIDSISIDNSDVKMSHVTTNGNGEFSDCSLMFENGCVNTVNIINSDVIIKESQLNCEISNSNVIANGIVTDSEILLSNSIIASDDYTYIVLGANCNHNKPIDNILQIFSELISLDGAVATFKTYILNNLNQNSSWSERGIIWATNPDDLDSDNGTVVTDLLTGLGIFNSSVDFPNPTTYYIRAYVKETTTELYYYGNVIEVILGQ